MYPHSAMIGGGTRDYYPNAIAQDGMRGGHARPRRGVLAAVASLLRRRRRSVRPMDGRQNVPARIPSPFHPSVLAKVGRPEHPAAVDATARRARRKVTRRSFTAALV